MVMPRRGTQSDRSKGLSSTTPAWGGNDLGHEVTTWVMSATPAWGGNDLGHEGELNALLL